MNKVAMFLISAIFICGCASVEVCENKNLAVKTYQPATLESKSSLLADLRSNQVKIGETIDNIKTAYGDADNIFVSGCTTRIIYRINNDKKVTLWFDDGLHLSMWNG